MNKSLLNICIRISYWYQNLCDSQNVSRWIMVLDYGLRWLSNSAVQVKRIEASWQQLQHSSVFSKYKNSSSKSVSPCSDNASFWNCAWIFSKLLTCLFPDNTLFDCDQLFASQLCNCRTTTQRLHFCLRLPPWNNLYLAIPSILSFWVFCLSLTIRGDGRLTRRLLAINSCDRYLLLFTWPEIRLTINYFNCGLRDYWENYKLNLNMM